MTCSGRDVVVIGGGITGALTARELAEAGWTVTVLEGAHVGAGSSSRTAAGIRQQFSTPETVRGMRYSVRFYEQFTERVGGRTCPIHQNGYLFLLDTDAALASARARVAMQRAVGLSEVELLDRAALIARFPWVDPDVVVGGTFCPSDGFLLPEVVYNEAIEAARRLGARVVQRAPVVAARHSGGRLTEVDTPKGWFSADLFVDATNAWTCRLARVLGGEDLDVAPLKRYLWFLSRGGAMTAAELRAMPLTIAPSGAYCRPENGNTLLLGKKHDVAPDPTFAYEDQDTIEPAYSHLGGVDAEPYALWAELAAVLPAVGSFDGFSATTAGYYATTPDHNPFLGFDRQVPNLLRLVGFSGHGAMFGPFTALVARELAEAGRDLDAVRVDGSPVRVDAFRIGRAYAHQEQLVI